VTIYMGSRAGEWCAVIAQTKRCPTDYWCSAATSSRAVVPYRQVTGDTRDRRCVFGRPYLRHGVKNINEENVFILRISLLFDGLQE